MGYKITKPKSKNIPKYNKRTKLWEVSFPDRKEEGCLEYVVSEYIMDGLIYEFNVDGEVHHEHTFEALLDDILYHINEGRKVDIKGLEKLYSTQEKRIINKFIKKLNVDINKG